jgi:hypothetical protein
MRYFSAFVYGAVSVMFSGFCIIMIWAARNTQVNSIHGWDWWFTPNQFFSAMFLFLTFTSILLAFIFAHIAITALEE